MGRPPYVPTQKDRGLVQGYAACGTPETEIARLLDIDPKTLRKHYRDELDLAHLQANAKVAQTLFKVATSGAHSPGVVTAMIFWLKCRGGWKDATRVEHVGKDGGTIEHSVAAPTADISALDRNDRDALRRLIGRVSAGEPGSETEA